MIMTEMSLGEEYASLARQLSSACDACHSRKVRCDKNHPCGNCQDQGTTCTHQRRRRRLPKRAAHLTGRKTKPSQSSHIPTNALIGARNSLRKIAAHEGADPGVSNPPGLNLPPQALAQQMFKGANMMRQLHSWISLIPLTDAQLENRRQLECLGDLTWTRRQAFESALDVAGQTSSRVRAMGKANIREHNSAVEHHTIPSLELLTWIVRDVGSGRFGSFVLDYFRHVSMSTLKRMGLSLLRKETSHDDSVLYTVCVNAVAAKFLNTVLMTDDLGELTGEIRAKAFQHQTAAQAALKEIRLLTAPSLVLLQALLCGIFLHQRSGDTQLCSELTRTACRVCVDLGLPDVVNGHQATEEEYYCVMWCYMLDRSYAWKLGRSRCFVNINTRATVRDSLPNDHLFSDLLQAYMSIAQVQDLIIPCLGDLPSSLNRDDGISSFYVVREHLTSRMENIRSKIDQIAPLSPKWRGLDPHSEIAALNFAYHSVMTTIFHLSQVLSTQSRGAEELYLQSARQELSALVSMCLSNDNENTAAFLHWTLLYWPLTACLILFCNAVATSHLGDFTLLQTAANCLLPSSTISQPVATLQRLFQELVTLSQGFFTETTFVASTAEPAVQLQSIHLQETTAQQSSTPPACTLAGTVWNEGTDGQLIDPSALLLGDILSHGDLELALGAEFSSLN